MVRERVESSAHAETQRCAERETGKDKLVGRAGARVPRGYHGVHVQHGDGHQHQRPHGVRPDVDALVVHADCAQQRREVAVARRPVPRQYEGIVAPPVRQLVPEKEKRR